MQKLINIKYIKIAILQLLILIFIKNSYINANENNYLNICTASNFLSTLKVIKIQFEKEYKCKIIISSDSTTNIYTKIINGAPFDIFISADSKHIELLKKQNLTLYKDYTYAIGKLIFLTSSKNIKSIKKNKNNIAIANKKLSPYGKATSNVIKNTKLKIKNNIIYGCNINQVFNFIKSGNSKTGFISLSQIKNKEKNYWTIPKYLYPKINQKTIILKNTKNFYLSKEFIKYMKKKYITTIIYNSGYNIPKT